MKKKGRENLQGIIFRKESRIEPKSIICYICALLDCIARSCPSVMGHSPSKTPPPPPTKNKKTHSFLLEDNCWKVRVKIRRHAWFGS